MFNYNVDLPTVSAREIFFCKSSEVMESRLETKNQNELLISQFQDNVADSHNSLVGSLPTYSGNEDREEASRKPTTILLSSEDTCQNIRSLFRMDGSINFELFNISLLDGKTLDFNSIQFLKLPAEVEEKPLSLLDFVELRRTEELSGPESSFQIADNEDVKAESGPSVPEVEAESGPDIPESQTAQESEFEERIPPISPPAVEPEEPDPVEIEPPQPLPETTPEMEPPETPPEATPETEPPPPIPEQVIEEIDWRQNSLESLNSTSQRYPFIVNPTDNLTFEPQLFRPFRDEQYSTLDLRFAEDNPVLNKFTFAHFPKGDQFYWLLPGNRVVVETQGVQGGVIFQGRSTVSQFTQSVIPQQRFFGLQAVWSVPPSIPDLIAQAGDDTQFAVLSVAGQVTTPPGIPAGEVTINSGFNNNNTNTVFLPNIGSGSTNNPQGGGSLFQNLDRDNAPRFIQAFPTNNLRPLLNNGVALREGAIIPPENLEATGIGFTNLDTGQGFAFSVPTTSAPGIKIGQPGGGMNPDLLNLVVNPFLSPRERDLRYLNSLFWFSLGERTVADVTQLDSQESSDWYRFYFSVPHRKTTIEYDAEEIEATYRSVFSNPGISLTASLELNDVDEVQFANATIGLGIGIIFAGIENNHIEDSLEEAYTALENGEGFAFLNTAATSAERRQMNQRLNQNLFNTERVTKLEQVSGNYTFPARINPIDSTLFQIRTGLHKRRVEFFRQDVGEFREISNFFLGLDTSQDFGPLDFIGVPIPTNESAAVEVTLISPDGRQFVQQFNSNPRSTVVPIIAGKAFDIAFDSIRIGQLVERNIETNGFVGELLLPSIELVTSGTDGDFNYGVSLGTWFNVNPDSVAYFNNDLGLEEPSFGVYARGIANFLFQDVKVDENNQPIAIETQSPFLDIDWNSATNRLNTFQISAGYVFSRRGRNSGYSIAGVLAYIPQGSNGVNPENSNGEFLGFIDGQLGTEWGTGFDANFEIGNEVFFDLELTQRVIEDLSVGLFYQNFNNINIGLNSRIDDSYYGAIIRYFTSDRRINIDAQLGHSDNGFDARLKSTLRFNF
jgi:hypothetical protein